MEDNKPGFIVHFPFKVRFVL